MWDFIWNSIKSVMPSISVLFSICFDVVYRLWFFYFQLAEDSHLNTV